MMHVEDPNVLNLIIDLVSMNVQVYVCVCMCMYIQYCILALCVQTRVYIHSMSVLQALVRGMVMH